MSVPLEQNRDRSEDTNRPETRRLVILPLSGIFLTIFLAALDGTIVATAMPRIVEELQGFSLYAWVTTIYLLTSTATIPIAGKLGDLFGRKWVLLAFVIIFLVGSGLSGAAPSMLWLVIFRGFQGIGSGGLQANAVTVISDLFHDPVRRARWQGIIAAAFGMSSVLGPGLGGLITDTLNWRWVFYVNLPVGLLALAALAFTLPYRAGSGSGRIDWLGATTITAAIVALLLALSWGGQKEPNGYPWLSLPILGLVLAVIVFTTLFLYIETKVAEPIMPLRLFRLPVIRGMCLIGFALGLVILGTLLYVPLYAQVVLGLSASGSGAVTTVISLAIDLASLLAGYLISWVKALKLPTIGGALLTVVGVALLLTLGTASSSWQLVLFLIIVGFGLGILFPILNIGSQAAVERRDLGVGTATIQFFQSIGGTVGTGLIGTIVATSYVEQVNAGASGQNFSSNTLALIQEPQNLINPQLAATLPLEAVTLTRQALVAAIHNGFLITLALAGVGLLTALFIPNLRLDTSGTQQGKQTNTGAEERAVTGKSAQPTGMQPLISDNRAATNRASAPAPLVTITYQVGSGGAEIARTLAQALNMEYYDRKIILHAADQLGIKQTDAQILNETIREQMPRILTWLSTSNLAGTGPLPGIAPDPLEEMYYHHSIQQIIESIAQANQLRGAVIAGYRAPFALNKWPGLFNVYLYAPLEERVQQVAEQEKMNIADAQTFIEQRDAERSHYIRTIYGQNWNDPRHYDLMINSGKVPATTIVDLIAWALGKKPVEPPVVD
jgi:EmrB/QacA subfamily drug resistance transporter